MGTDEEFVSLSSNSIMVAKNKIFMVGFLIGWNGLCSKMGLVRRFRPRIGAGVRAGRAMDVGINRLCCKRGAWSVTGDFSGNAVFRIGFVFDGDLEWQVVQFNGVTEMQDTDGVTDCGQSRLGAFCRLDARVFEAQAVPME